MEGVPSSCNYAGGFRTDFQLKDMLLAVQLANESKTLATLGMVACNLFAIHCDNGYAAADYSSIMIMMHKALAEAQRTAT
jgi:3-hydroxyisobutyrate dehydrogenase